MLVHIHILYIRALLVFCTVRSLSKIEFHALLFGKRVQRYGLFLNWQNNSPTFFRKIEKKDKMGQKEGNNEEDFHAFRQKLDA